MIVIQIDPATKQAIVAHRDIERLKQVIEAEVKKMQEMVNNQADATNFRFYQGALQSLKAVNHLLHP